MPCILIVTLHLLVFVLLAWCPVLARPRTTTPPACTQYAEPGGATVQGWLASAQPGQVLCLKGGTYTDGEQMLSIPADKGGTPAQPLWIRAEHEGAVLIDGQFGQRPLDCAGHDVVLWGFNLKDGNDSTLVLRGNRCAALRTVAYSTASWGGIDNIVDLGGTNNLLEDASVWGYARKGIAAGARGGESGNVIRRVWVEWNGFIPGGADPGNPTNPLEVGYDQDKVTVENAIVRRNVLTQATDPQAPFALFSSWNSWVGGLISYLLPGDRFDTHNLAYVFPQGGSHEGSGHANKGNVVTQSVFVIPAGFSGASGFWFQGGQGSSGNRADRLVGVDPQRGSGCSGDGWSCTNLKLGTTLGEALGSGKTIWDSVPATCKRLVNRQLTEDALWPWAMEQRTAQAWAADGRGTLSIQGQVESVFGPIPAACKSGGAPIPPEPQPAPPEAWTCTGSIASVPGSVTMQCLPQTGGRR